MTSAKIFRILVSAVTDNTPLQEFLFTSRILQVGKYYIPAACTTSLSPCICSFVSFGVPGAA